MQKCIAVVLFLLLLSAGLGSAILNNNVRLKEKIGQMLLIGFRGQELHPEDPIVQAILAQNIGGVILYDYDFQSINHQHNISNPEQLKKLTEQLQSYTRTAATHHNNNLYPLLIGVDYEGGAVNRLKEEYGFPKTLSAEELGKLSYEKAAQYAKQMAETLRQEGINLNFAPVIDLNINPDSPAIGKFGRSFSADPQKVIDYAAIFSKAYHAEGILCAYKHFPGHGSATEDTHQGFVDITQTWNEIELEPYLNLLQQPGHCPIVMTAHLVHYGLDSKGYPASISSSITKELLREKMNFDGVVITDDLQMKAITDHFKLAEVLRMAINAGADILVFANQLSLRQDPQQIVDMIYADVMTGKIQESRINEAYDRIMKLKKQLNKPNPSTAYH